MENTNLLLNLSENEMLALCKRVMNLEPATHGCTIVREDGIDMDAWLLTRARAWYASLLESAPIEWLPVEDVKDIVTATNCGNGVVTAFLPQHCIRPVEWQLKGWHHSVTTFAHPQDEIGRLQDNPWTRGGLHLPVAVNHGNRLLLYSIDATSTPVVTMARCVVCPVDNHFIFHQSAISSLEQHLNS